MIRVLLNNEEITNNVEIDLSFVEKLDRELDEGFLVISHTDKPEQYPIFSIIDILENNKIIFSGRVSMDVVELSSHSDSIYNHNITIIEHTKLLEKFLVNGKSFTQPIIEGVSPLYTLYDVVETLRTTTLLELTGDQDFNTPFLIEQKTKEELQSIIAPEITFKDVTLRQALDEVGNYIDGIARLTRNGFLVYDKFNELLEEIDGVTESFKKQQNVSEYSTILSSDVINPVNDNEINTEYYPAKDLWTTLRSPFGQFDFESSFIPTPKPIYRIKSILTPVDLLVEKIFVETGAPTETIIDNDFFTVDLSSNVVEKSIYDTLNDEDTVIFTEKTKRNTFYYEYGKRNIFSGQTFGLFGLITVLEKLIDFATIQFLIKEGFLPPGGIYFRDLARYYEDPEGNVQYNIQILKLGQIASSDLFRRWENLWRVEYIPIPPSIRYEVARDDVSEVDLYTFSTVNQKLRIIDLNAFTNNMKGRINQMSSGELMLSHKVSSINDSWNIGDFTSDGFVITKKEVITQRDHYIINYELNKNFNKKSQFVGIDQEIRQWEIGESGRSIDRDLNYNEFIEVYADDNGLSTQGDTTLATPGLLLQTLDKNFQGALLKHGIFSSPQLVDENDDQIELNLAFYKISGGNAFGVYTDFETNSSIGDVLSEGDEGFLNFGNFRRYNIPQKYSDEIGRFDTMFVTFHTASLAIQQGTFQEEVEAASALPVFTKNPLSPTISGNFFVKKDNRERLKFTLLYHFISKNIEEVIVGDKFTSHNVFFIKKANNVELRLFKNKKFTTRDRKNELNDFFQRITSNFLTIDTTNMYIELNQNVDLTDIDAWALTDENGLPFIMVNKNSPIKRRIVFEFRNKRSNLNYTFFPTKREEVDLSADGQGLATLNFSFNTGNTVALPLTANGVGSAFLDFTAAIAQKVQLIASNKGRGVLNFIAAFYKKQLRASSVGLAQLNFSVQKDQVVQLTASGKGEAFFTSTDLQFEKKWVAKAVSPPYAVSIDLGEVQTCPTQQFALDLLESQFPASNQNLGDKAFVGNAFTIDPNTFDIFICQNYTFEVEAV